MIDPPRLSVFCAACIAIAAVPGPAVLYIVTRSVEHGRRAGLASAASAASGAGLQKFAAAAGLASLLIAGTAADWLRKKRRFAKMQRYVAGIVFVGLGVTAALTGSTRSR